MKEPEHDARMVDVCLHRIVFRQAGPRQYIHLRERDGERSFPIVIGTSEAEEIHRVVTGQELARPMTHKLTHNVIEALGARMTRVDIVDLRDNTFHARILIEGTNGNGPVVVDARPSDAIALALRAGCPIRVAENVLEQVRTDRAEDKLEETDEETEEE